jgi:hypothetical protein
MKVLRVMQLMQRSIPLAAAVVVGAAPLASAQRQGEELFEWSGRVDREVQIVMRNGRVDTRDLSNNTYPRTRTRVFSQIPRQTGQVVVSKLNGRGSVDVVQQPDARNGYTTILRIADPRGGADDYRIATYWQGYASGDVGRDRGDRDRGDRDRGDRDRGDRDRGDRGRDYPGDNRDRGNGGYGNGSVNSRNGTLLRWSGNVDGELEIRIQNGRVNYRTLSGAQPTSMRADLGTQGGQRSNGSVAIAGAQGRGQVNVIQQPTAQNGYTTVIRVRDPQGGYGYYNFDAVWQ